MADALPIMQFEVDPNHDVQSIVASLLVFASAVFSGQVSRPGEF